MKKNNKLTIFIIKNIIYILSYIFSILIKKRDIIIFSGRRGTDYFDNSRYLFEYAINNDKFKKYQFKWLYLDGQNLPTDKIYRNNCINLKSIRGLYYFFSAKVAFVSYSSTDFGWLATGPRTKLIQLWHGIPLKNIFLSQKKISYMQKLLEIYEMKKYDHFIVSSSIEKNLIESMSKSHLKNIDILGYPRNDILKLQNENENENENEKYNIKKILFAPTFRENGNVFSMISIDEWKLFFNNIRKLNIKLFIRAHKRDFSNQNLLIEENDTNIIFADSCSYPDVQELMINSDILISDYSGIIADYLLLDKPIIRFIFDEEEYNLSRGVTFHSSELSCGYITRDLYELYSIILNLKESNNKKDINFLKYHKNLFHKNLKPCSQEILNKYLR
ncbi:CDP-glycerol glycerophosphotransferase family protein [Proteus penneri]|uniref:CDP-glycerol glycerophosphotransferase family protein n=1 Tax=Proteus penneri TaxID=102862 RepID=UPI001EFA4CA7|nr:CDP-glycerol glycerophosphotransferase family protein [Proteus penneri]